MQFETAIRQKLVSTESFIIMSPFFIANSASFLHGELAIAESLIERSDCIVGTGNKAKLISTELFLIVRAFLIASPDYLHMENWAAQ